MDMSLYIILPISRKVAVEGEKKYNVKPIIPKKPIIINANVVYVSVKQTVANACFRLEMGKIHEKSYNFNLWNAVKKTFLIICYYFHLFCHRKFNTNYYDEPIIDKIIDNVKIHWKTKKPRLPKTLKALISLHAREGTWTSIPTPSLF